MWSNRRIRRPTGQHLQWAGHIVAAALQATRTARYYAPPLGPGALSDDARLTSICLSVAYIGSKSRTERPRKTKIGTEVAHVTVTRTPLSRSKGQRSTCRGRGHIVAASRTACFPIS